jgi:hypothetical protein
MRRTYLSSYLPTGTPQTRCDQDGSKRWYVLQNWRQDPVVTVTEAGVQVERSHFSPYGRAFGMPTGEMNFDGAVTNTDTNLISAWSGLGHPYRAYADVDLQPARL